MMSGPDVLPTPFTTGACDIVPSDEAATEISELEADVTDSDETLLKELLLAITGTVERSLNAKSAPPKIRSTTPTAMPVMRSVLFTRCRIASGFALGYAEIVLPDKFLRFRFDYDFCIGDRNTITADQHGIEIEFFDHRDVEHKCADFDDQSGKRIDIELLLAAESE